MSGLVNIVCTTRLSLHGYDELFHLLHMHGDQINTAVYDL